MELIFDFVAFIFRPVGYLLVDIVGELFLRGLGSLICRACGWRVDPDRFVVLLVGFICWIFIIFTCYLSFSFLLESFDVDRCLDSGGSYNYKAGICVKEKL
ncbi:hypothetical protein [Pseudoteredinibacter isoporae]|uniref:Uncharacterized protein n=1 Tax=Pseudoteredinibacter isoporae TaxID=570281 RepID=A0A7X0MXL7_9GAMM|nr:hypothetical protein [Pseudoteredinibacter isoporae]MBB6522124.1 hypothetical protein [Pseudoteredinibacter isoporae]NHO87659.1 hypothetical protein [Pseudoteredinibacter isoporae]NIB24010.1 hypothetical protein [Pseudoteredinibacter isoporae]